MDVSSSDEIIEEIRRSRCRMSEQCGHDLRLYIERLKQFNDRYARQVQAFRALSRPSLPTGAGR